MSTLPEPLPRSQLYVREYGFAGPTFPKRADELTLADLIIDKNELCSVYSIAVGEESWGTEPPQSRVRVHSTEGSSVGTPIDYIYRTVPIAWVVATFKHRVEIFDVGQCEAKKWQFGAVELLVVLDNGKVLRAGNEE